MEIHERTDGDVAFITLTDEFDAASLPEVSQAVTRAVEGGFKRVVLNVSGTSILTSSAVGYLIKASRHLTSEGGGLVIAEPPPWFQRTIDTLGVSDLIPLVPDDESAAGRLREGPPAP